jgi:hypothetical protein
VEFREAAFTERGFAAMLTAAKTMALTGLEVLTDSELLEEARAELRS